MKRKYNFNEELGISECTIIYKGHQFIGKAFIHPQDKDMESERVGLFIAETRADMKYLKYIKNYELQPQLQTLNHLYDCIKQSKKYDKNDPVTKKVWREIQAIKNQLDTVKQELTDEKQYLKEYLQKREKLYQRIRKNRQAEN